MISFGALKKNLRKDMASLPCLKVALLGDTATQFLAVALKGMGYERGYCLEVWESEYNQVERQILDSTSDLYRFGADYTVIFHSTHKLLEKYNFSSSGQQVRLADERLDLIRTICSSLPGRVIYYNYPEIEDTVFGSYANKIMTSFTYQLRKLNFELMNLAREIPDLFVCDLAGIQNKFGRDRLFDDKVYVSTDMVLHLDILPYVASRTMDILCAAEGKIKKCVILDLDNTLWGGVVGDDGWEHIQIGHGLGIGKAFTEFQQWIRKLKERGIILAVCSKNDEDKAKEPFLKNPEMVLKLEDIAVFIANWENKADNIRRIQEMLNIGFDSMVFLDDNLFERELVRSNLPGVTVPELPVDPAGYLEYLYSLNLFETISYSETDADRTRQYQVEAERKSLQAHSTDVNAFLKSLEMTCKVTGFNSFNIPRVAQLSQRSNQFNLRTIRYTEAEVESVKENDRYVNFAFTLSDKFGDNGLICVVILEKWDTETLFVDTWFMSCRVLKRGMENFTLNTVVAYARAQGFKRIVGEYLPTPKNQMVEEHYPKLGFRRIETGRTALYELDTDAYSSKECYIRPAGNPE